MLQQDDICDIIKSDSPRVAAAIIREQIDATADDLDEHADMLRNLDHQTSFGKGRAAGLEQAAEQLR